MEPSDLIAAVLALNVFTVGFNVATDFSHECITGSL